MSDDVRKSLNCGGCAHLRRPKGRRSPAPADPTSCVETPGDDVIAARGGDDSVRGLRGDDIVCAGAGADLVRGQGGDDTSRAGSGKDQLRGGAGSNRCRGGGARTASITAEQAPNALGSDVGGERRDSAAGDAGLQRGWNRHGDLAEAFSMPPSCSRNHPSSRLREWLAGETRWLECSASLMLRGPSTAPNWRRFGDSIRNECWRSASSIFIERPRRDRTRPACRNHLHPFCGGKIVRMQAFWHRRECPASRRRAGVALRAGRNELGSGRPRPARPRSQSERLILKGDPCQQLAKRPRAPQRSVPSRLRSRRRIWRTCVNESPRRAGLPGSSWTIGRRASNCRLPGALASYWETDYDWRTCEAKLNALPQFKTEIDGVDIHFIHVRSQHENALPLVMTHGWPGSVIELLETVGPLTDPTAHGGEAADAFHLVLPSLPGYGFSG